jgi:hypothetical protein
LEKFENSVLDLVGMPGRSFSVGRDGFIKLRAELIVFTVFVVFDRDGAFDVYDGAFEAEYAGSVVFVLIVSDRCSERAVDVSSSPLSFGRVGRVFDASYSPFLIALSSSFFSCWFCLSIAFLIFLLTIRSRRVSTLRRQYWVKLPSSLGM